MGSEMIWVLHKTSIAIPFGNTEYDMKAKPKNQQKTRVEDRVGINA